MKTRTKTYTPCNLGRDVISLGKEGEKNATIIVLDCSEWINAYPKAEVRLFVQSAAGERYYASLGEVSNARIWLVDARATKEAGSGAVEMQLIDVETDSLLKSVTGYTDVAYSISAMSTSDGDGGGNGEDGGYYEPHVNDAGDLSWTPSKADMPSVATKNIKGPKGDQGDDYVLTEADKQEIAGMIGGTGGAFVETDPTVPNWAKQPSKPIYTASEVGALPDTYKAPVQSVNGKTGAVTLIASDVGALPNTTEIPIVPEKLPNPQPIVINGISYDGSERKEITVQAGDGGSITETDPTVPAWAKAATKPTYTAEEVGALPNTYEAPVKSVNGKTGAVSLEASDVGALPDTTVIPTVPNALKNPYPLTINGVAYDGSEAKTINIQASGGGESVSLDTTLTQYGMAADAGAVGNALAQEKDAREEALNELKEANVKQDNRLTALEQAGGIVTIEPAQDDVPIVFFGGDLPQTKTDTVMPFKYVSKTKTVSGYVETKAQGNSSMSYAKKNQTVKMYADEALEDSVKVDFKGWGTQKKHVYKANWIDLTHSRNIVSARLWGDVVKSRANYLDLPELLRTSPNQGAVDGFPALVYANGVYQGRYTINIPKDAWMANMDDSLDEHCILCGENYVSGCFRATANINGSDWTDEIHDTVPVAIKTRWNEIISFVMNATDDDFKANLGNYFYLDSLIDYYIFGVVSCGLDAFGKNQLYQTYDGQKWIATMYDMDSTWGLWWNGGSFVATNYARTEFQDFKDGQGNLLYIRLEELFYEQIQARWAELKDTALSYSNIMTRFERFIGIVPPHIVKEDYASTTGGGKFTGIPSQSTNHIQQIRAYVAARLAYADEWFAAITPEEKIPCTGITLDQTTLTFDSLESKTLTATVTPSDTTDVVAWSSDDSSVASVSKGVVTAISNGTVTITATCGAYSAICMVTVDVAESGDDEPITSAVVWSDTPSYSVNNGTFASGTNYVTLEYIKVLPSTVVTLSNTGDGKYTWLGICELDENKTKLKYTESGNNNNPVSLTTQSGTRYVLLSANKGGTVNPDPSTQLVFDRELAPCTGITLDKTELTFAEIDDVTLTATTTPEITTNNVIWSSSDRTIASVDDKGDVCIRGNGTAVITVKCGEHSATCEITVSGVSVSPVPEDYQVLSYIQSSGTQYIDTGISGGSTSGWKIKMNSLGAVANSWERYLEGMNEANTTPSLMCYSTKEVAISSKSGGGLIVAPISDDDHTISVKNGLNIMIDGVVQSNVAANLDCTGWGTGSWYVFNSHNESTTTMSSMKLYYLCMWTNGELVRSFVPVMRKLDSVYGLYDAVNGQFYENAGQGAFTGA